MLKALSDNEPRLHLVSIYETHKAEIEPVAGPGSVSSCYSSEMEAMIQKELYSLSSSIFKKNENKENYKKSKIV